MNTNDYRSLHEKFMQNNNGTTIEESFITILPVFGTTFIAVNLLWLLRPAAVALAFGVEFMVIVVSMIFYQTIVHHRIWEMNWTLWFVVVTMVSKQMNQRWHLAPFVRIPTNRPAFITLVRGVINLITAVCILAVDFKCFPRKLAKTETFGFGLMDTGVGLYVYGNAIIAPELYKIDYGQSNWRQRLSPLKLRAIVCGCVPLFVLGIGRFVVINEIDYQQHTSEYGVHWNFFLTLAFTKIFGTIILAVLPSVEYCKYAAIMLLVVHETVLQLGLKDYVINSDVKRDTWLNANREGVVSILGYVSLYMASMFVGSMLKLQPDTGNSTSTTTRRQKLKPTIYARPMAMKAVRIAVLSLILWKLTYSLRDLFGVSRRMANMGYVIWILSIATTMTALFILLEVFYYFITFDAPGRQMDDTDEDIDNNCIPLIFRAINYNGLAFFLGANLLTGLVNIMVQTLLVDTALAVLLLIVYMLVLCGITVFLYTYRIQLKAW